MGAIKLYIFSSAKLENIEKGIKARTWAVTDIDAASMKTRFTKSQSMEIGSKGIFYCSQYKYYTVPFVTESKPTSVNSRVSDIWDGEWALPFKIQPLGPTSRIENLKFAKSWPMFKDVSNVTVVAPMGGRFAFNAIPASEDDWKLIIRVLGYREGESGQ